MGDGVNITSIFKEGQTVKLVDTGERVTVVEVRPVGLHVFYRVEHGNGKIETVSASRLRGA